MKNDVPFNAQYVAKNEVDYVMQQIIGHHKAPARSCFAGQCKFLLEQICNSPYINLTSSCTASLEIACLAAEIGPGDEVILPSYNFTSAANAVALRGATPVFVDVKRNTLNIDEAAVVSAITSKTKALIAVHYAGNACNMRMLSQIAKQYGLYLIEDAAQGLGASYFGKPLGSIGDFGAVSFHKTKNIHCWEGGAFLSQTSDWERFAAQVIEKGTNRWEMLKGEVSKYTWVSLGSSYVLSEIQQAVLAAQLEDLSAITQQRVAAWEDYHQKLEYQESLGNLTRPSIEPGASLNGHIYYIVLPRGARPDRVIKKLASKGINALTHYEPLHLSRAGKQYGRVSGSMSVTEECAAQLLRLPIWPGLRGSTIDYIVDQLGDSLA